MNDVADAISVKGDRPSGDATSRVGLPKTIRDLIVQAGVRHQAALVVLTVFVFLIELIPLELQRRIVNDVVGKQDLQLLVLLCAAYAALVLVHGALKLGLNVYRSWVGEKTTRQLRRHIGELIDTTQNIPRAHMTSGTSVSLMLAEVDPIGAFVGGSVSEPLLQAGILLTVFGYMITLQPFVALITLAIFSPQFIFVPLMQRVINRRTAARVKILRQVGGDIVASVTKDQASADNKARIDRIFELNMGIFRVKFSMNFLMNLVHHLQIVGALLFGGWCVVQGLTEVGTIVAFVSGITRTNDPWGDLVNYFRDLTSAKVKYRLLVDAVDAIAGDGAGH